jgi:2-polyprenyl-6-methoxyphenol hydroxylase-like FAD-dependent oxidoreductase
VPRENNFDITWVTSLVGHELHRLRYPSANDARAIIRATNDGGQASEPGLRASQIVIESVLKKAIDKNPFIDVRFGTAFDKIIDQDGNGVTTETWNSETGAVETVRCQYLAGRDGGGSRVRRQIGVELAGDMAVAGGLLGPLQHQGSSIIPALGYRMALPDRERYDHRLER